MSTDQTTPRRGDLVVVRVERFAAGSAGTCAVRATRVRLDAIGVSHSSPGTALPEPRRVLTS